MYTVLNPELTNRLRFNLWTIPRYQNTSDAGLLYPTCDSKGPDAVAQAASGQEEVRMGAFPAAELEGHNDSDNEDDQVSDDDPGQAIGVQLRPEGRGRYQISPVSIHIVL